MTVQIAAAGKLLDIEVLDHLVIGERTFVSMREKRLGFR
jgi:DNA repair protein RadC